jgi:uncharacterized protein with ATP-grasp and redox domains
MTKSKERCCGYNTLGTKNESLQEAILKSIFEIIQETDTSKPAAYTTTFIHRKIRQQIVWCP